MGRRPLPTARPRGSSLRATTASRQSHQNRHQGLPAPCFATTVWAQSHRQHRLHASPIMSPPSACKSQTDNKPNYICHHLLHANHKRTIIKQLYMSPPSACKSQTDNKNKYICHHLLHASHKRTINPIIYELNIQYLTEL